MATRHSVPEFDRGIGNRIRDVLNPTNPNVSGGIRCVNGNPDKSTQTLIADNSIRGCGVHGIHVENHGGSLVSGNSVVESERSGLLVSTIRDLRVLDNDVFNSDLTNSGSQGAIHLINGADGVTLRGNSMRNLELFETAFAREGE